MHSGIVFINGPIGNTDDISIQALNYLKQIEYIYCEDTRKTKDLLKRLNISLEDKNFNSYHDHSGSEKEQKICEFAATHLCAYLSDAGSPVISDPAYPLIKSCLRLDVPFKVCSGITAPVHALEVSGLPPLPYHFYGFLPREKGKIKSAFEELSHGTHIFFEGVSRVKTTLQCLAEVHPLADVCVCRELTKTYQEVLRFKAKDHEKIEMILKGEFVLLFNIEGQTRVNSEFTNLAEEIMQKGNKSKLVAKLIGKILDKNTKEIYDKLSRN